MIVISISYQESGGKECILSAVWFKDLAVTEISQEGGGHFINPVIEGIGDSEPVASPGVVRYGSNIVNLVVLNLHLATVSMHVVLDGGEN